MHGKVGNKMRRILITISLLFTLNLSALELTDMLKDIERGDDYRTCLNQHYSQEFCNFSREMTVMFYNIGLMQKANEPLEAIVRYTQRITSSYICDKYRTMSNIDKFLLDEIYFNGKQSDLKKEYYDAICY